MVSNNLWCDRDLFLEKGGFPEAYQAASSEDMEFSWTVSRDHKLWWDADNGVYHDFASTLSGYLGQQFRFAKDAVPMLVGNRSLVNGGRTHYGKQLFIEVAFTGLGLILPVLFLGVVAANWGFLTNLNAQRGQEFAIKALGMAFLRNFTIIWGVFIGFIEFFTKKSEK